MKETIVYAPFLLILGAFIAVLLACAVLWVILYEGFLKPIWNACTGYVAYCDKQPHLDREAEIGKVVVMKATHYSTAQLN